MFEIKQKFDSVKQKFAEKAKEIAMSCVFEKDSFLNEKSETLLPKVRNEIELLLPQLRQETEILIDNRFQQIVPMIKKVGIAAVVFLFALLVILATYAIALLKIAFF